MTQYSETINDPLRDLAIRITEFAKRYQLLNDAYLSNLIKSLVNKNNLHIWAEINPFEHFPRASAKKHILITNITKVMTIVRNVAVFIPIAVIWRAVGEATTQFEIYVSENSGAITNFLTFWQNGYGYLEEEYTIGHVAFVDFLIIVGIIVLTFILNITDAVANSIKENEEAVLDKERDSLCFQLIEETSAYRKIDANSLEKTFYKIISEVNRSIEELKNIITIEKKSAKELTEASQGLAAEQGKWGEITLPEFTQFNLALENLTKSINQLNNLSSEEIPKSLDKALSQIEMTGGALKDANLSINKNTKELVQEISRLKSRLSRIKKSPKK